MPVIHEKSLRIGKIIRKYRRMMNVSVNEIVEKTGIPRSTYWTIEQGKVDTSYVRVWMILEYLKHPVTLRGKEIELENVLLDMGEEMKRLGFKAVDVYNSLPISARTVRRMLKVDSNTKFWCVSEVFEWMGTPLTCNGEKI